MIQPFFLSVRAIEDIIGIEKPGENSGLSTFNEIEEVVYSVNNFDSNYSFSEENDLSSLQEFKSIESNSNHSKISKINGKNGSEGDYSIRNSFESIKFAGQLNSETELRSWPSDSDITILRMKKEFRNELSAKMDWEEERHLTDASSHNLEWESHSLINLADVLKEKDQAEGLTPFTIWAKGSDQGTEPAAETSPDSPLKNPIEIELTEQKLTETFQDVAARNSQDERQPGFLKADQDSIIDASEEKVEKTTKAEPEKIQKEDVISRPSKSKIIRGFFGSIFRCGSKKRGSVDEIDTS